MNDQESIVYGCIKDVADFDLQQRKINRSVISSLPKTDGLEVIHQEMFSMPSLLPLPGNYQTEVMHFGASYQAIEYEWARWIRSFEQLLEKMYWHSAVVHLETELSGIHTFYWQATNNRHLPNTGHLSVRCEWIRERGLVSAS